MNVVFRGAIVELKKAGISADKASELLSAAMQGDKDIAESFEWVGVNWRLMFMPLLADKILDDDEER